MTGKKNAERIKIGKYRTEDQEEIKRFIIILIVLVIVILGVYFFTRLFVTKDLLNKEEKGSVVTPGEINYDLTLIGSIFNKKEDVYYVIMYDKEDLNAVYYGGLVSNYQKNTEPLKVYFADLSNELNKKYVDLNNINLNTNDINNFRVGNLALLKIEKGQIIKALTEEEVIAKELEYIKNTNS